MPGRTLTLRFVMLSVRSLSQSTERCNARQITLDNKHNNVWSGLKHLGTREHGECSDPWSEL